LQAHQPPPIALVGAAFGSRRQSCANWCFPSDARGAPRFAASRGSELRLGGRAAAVRQSQHLEFGDHPLQGQAEADHRCARDERASQPLGVQMNLASVDGAVARERVL